MLRHVLKVKLEQLKPFVLHLISQNSLKVRDPLNLLSVLRNFAHKFSPCIDTEASLFSMQALSALLQESLPRNGPIGAGVTKCSSCFDSIHENLLLSCKDSLKCIVL